MRVLHVVATFTPDIGGPYVACAAMASSLARRGHDVSVFTTGASSLPAHSEVRADGWTLSTYPRSFRGDSWCASRALWQALKAEIRNCDIAHIHGGYIFPVQAAALASRRARTPYVMRPHGIFDPYLRRRHAIRKYIYDLWQSRDFDQASAIHFTAADEARLAKSLGFKAPTIVLPLGFDLEPYLASPVLGSFRKRYLGHSPTAPLILFVGRLHPKKGVDILIDALVQIRAVSPGAVLAIVGPDGPSDYVRGLHRRVAELELGSHVVFTGPLYHEDKVAALHDASVWVLPSHTENFGVAIVEALAAGVPTVTTHSVNIWQDLAEARAALIVDAEAEQIARAVVNVLRDPAEGAAMARRARAFVVSKYGLASLGAGLESAYDAILRQAGMVGGSAIRQDDACSAERGE